MYSGMSKVQNHAEFSFTRKDRHYMKVCTLTAYTDTSDMDCVFTVKSTGGYIIYVNG
jgi:hypothetical protein